MKLTTAPHPRHIVIEKKELEKLGIRGEIKTAQTSALLK